MKVLKQSLLVMLLGSVLFLFSNAAIPAATEFYVAANGNDTNPGTKDKPFAMLEAARDAIRALKQQGKMPTDGVTVWIRGGTYPREKSFALNASDSGLENSPVVYRACENESVRLSGGRAIHGFRPVSNPAVLNRLDEQARGHVLEANLRDQGMSDFGRFRSRGFARPTAPSHMELFVGGQPMTPARWPNEGAWEKIAGFPESAGQDDSHGGKIGRLADGFFYSGDRPRRWKNFDDVWVHGYWAWDWANSYERIESLDPETRLIKTASPHGIYGFRSGQRFYFSNVLEELDQPGEWYLDRKSGMVYLWPPRPIEPNEVKVSLLESPLITMSEVSHVTIRGVVLEATRGNAIEIRGGKNDRIDGCAIRLIGNWGVRIEGGRGHGVLSCDIENTGDGGVSLAGGDRQTLAPGGHSVENCHFQKQGRWSKCYVPAVLVRGVGHRVAHNLIHDHPHCAILFNGNEHQIEFNEIHHVALETGDVGAIYTGRDWTFRGNAIRHNFIHETGGVGMGSMGVYMDDCVSGAEIRGNIFYKVTRAVFIGGGRDHRVENNIFVDCSPSVAIDARGMSKSPVWHNMVYDFMKKQLQAVPQDLYRKRYPAIVNLDRYYQLGEGVPPEGNVVAHNVSAGGKWLVLNGKIGPDWLDQRDNWVGDDPGFVSRDTMDFRLQKDSPAWRLGFQAIPMEEIGLRDDESRRGLVKVKNNVPK